MRYSYSQSKCFYCPNKSLEIPGLSDCSTYDIFLYFYFEFNFLRESSQISLLLPHFFCEFAFTFKENHPFSRETFWKNWNTDKTLKYRHVPFLEACLTDSTLITKEFDSQFLGRGVSQLQLFTVTFYLKLASLLEGADLFGKLIKRIWDCKRLSKSIQMRQKRWISKILIECYDLLIAFLLLLFRKLRFHKMVYPLLHW